MDHERRIPVLKLFRFTLSLLALSLGIGVFNVCAAQDRDRWDAVPHEFREFQRQGFQDGLSAAQQDFDLHRRPDVNIHAELRHPSVPPNMVNDYKDGFHRGYDAGVRHLFPNGLNGAMPWDRPTERHDVQPVERHDDGQRGVTDFHRLGFNDGLIGAQKDFDNQRRPDVNNRDEFRNPNVPAGARDDYREGFRRGYEEGVHRAYRNAPPPEVVVAPPPPPPPPPSPWISIPRQSAQMQKIGYLDGILAAGQDYDAGMAPSVESHPEYHSSKLSFLVRVLYKAGYKSGYDLASHNFADRIEGTSSPVQRRGFLDGIAAIRQDYDAKRRPDMNIHPEYNNPQVEANRQNEYREAYSRGFDVASSYLY